MASMKTAFLHGNKKVANDIFRKAKLENLINLKFLILYIGTIFNIIGFVIKKLYYKI